MKYKFKQTSSRAARDFTSGSIGTGFLFRSAENLAAYSILLTSVFCLPFGVFIPHAIKDAMTSALLKPILVCQSPHT